MGRRFSLTLALASTFCFSSLAQAVFGMPSHSTAPTAHHIKTYAASSAKLPKSKKHKVAKAVVHVGKMIAHLAHHKSKSASVTAVMPKAAPDWKVAAHKTGHSKSSTDKTASAKVPSGKNFMWDGPSETPLDLTPESRENVMEAFASGRADQYSPSFLTRAQVFAYQPLHGGIYRRREQVKYIIVHSTETAKPADAQRVIASWNHRGLRHPGAQFIVDRDGTIYNTVDPTFATVHVNDHKTLAGVNNDNSIGIEIVHTGDQQYTETQMESVARLVAYLQTRYGVTDGHIYSHHYVQPSDRSDPVAFDWNKFALEKSELGSSEAAYNHPAATPRFHDVTDGG